MLAEVQTLVLLQVTVRWLLKVAIRELLMVAIRELLLEATLRWRTIPSRMSWAERSWREKLRLVMQSLERLMFHIQSMNTWRQVIILIWRLVAKVPARRLAHARGAYSVNADFAWLDKVKFIVLVVACTNMVASFVLTDNVEKNARELNGWLREVGLTGKSMDLTIDGEGHLRHLFQRAMNVGASPLTGMNFIPIPPDRHQANGIAERMVSAIKELVCTHLLFLEERLRIRIPFESPIVNHVARTSTMFPLGADPRQWQE